MDDEHREREISDRTVRIDRTLCIGSGNCESLAPEVFYIDTSNLAAFQDNIPDDMDRGRVMEACGLCPVDALRVTDEDGEQLVP
jgi:ferredoxin